MPSCRSYGASGGVVLIVICQGDELIIEAAILQNSLSGLRLASCSHVGIKGLECRSM